IYAGSDLFLMPSRFEPCGLGQMMALRYGTIPIVRATGGLKDSVHGYASSDPKAANGFVFEEYSSGELLNTLRQAVEVYREPVRWKQLTGNAFRSDYSWPQSARRYDLLYQEAVAALNAAQKPLALDCPNAG